MKVDIIGGGPAGLYFACQLLKADSSQESHPSQGSHPSHEVTVYERNARGNTFGWGVVFSASTLGTFLEADEITCKRITDTFAYWDDINVYFGGEVINSTGHGFCGISRQRLLDVLEDRAEELGAKLLFETEVDVEKAAESCDLLVAADGINSSIRNKYAEYFKPDLDVRNCKFIWLGTHKTFEEFTFIFKETEFGWFQAHCYRFDKDLSTFIVECHEDTWRKAGIEEMSKEDGVSFCQELFAEDLDGNELMSNAEHLRGSHVWLNFPRVNCETWHHKNIVLLGDAAATAHFSIGSGTKLAMESAIALADKVSRTKDLNSSLQEYEDERRLEVLKLQSAARNSTQWFEQVELKTKLEPKQFAYSLVTRSQRVSHENLRLRDKAYLENYEKWLAEKETGQKYEKAVPPMFLPFVLRDMKLKNRVVCSPMAMYSADEGTVNDFHLVHLGMRALGGAGLIYTEMTCPSADARITPGCAGIYSDEHEAEWKRVVDFVHINSDAKIAMQLGHAGRKGSTKLAWDGMDKPLDKGNWPIYGPSPIQYSDENQVPIGMTREDMDRVREEFVTASRRAVSAGFDLLELHCAHGYLFSSFISPLTNTRSDEYGGSLENRLRFPLEVFTAMREVWPSNKPMSVRISATDWVDGGTAVEDSIQIAELFKERDLDCIDVSTGQVSPDQKPVYGRMFQVPFAEQIRLNTGLKTMAVGNIYEPDHVNSILAAGRADLCLLARPHLWDPMWTIRAAAEIGYEDIEWPKQYESGKIQIENICRRAREMESSGPI